LPYINKGDWIKEHLLTCLQAAKDNNPMREIVYSENIYQILLRVNYEVCDSIESMETGKSKALIKSVNEFLEENLYEKPNLSEFAQYCGFSKCYFTKKFKKQFSVSPIRYFYNAKLEYSKRLLVYSNASIGNIALNLGFETQNHFSKAFKDHVGLCPRMYRKMEV